MPRTIILILLLVIASICYLTGFTYGAGVLIVFGLLFELAFWIKLFTIDKPMDNKTKDKSKIHNE